MSSTEKDLRPVLDALDTFGRQLDISDGLRCMPLSGHGPASMMRYDSWRRLTISTVQLIVTQHTARSNFHGKLAKRRLRSRWRTEASLVTRGCDYT